ncbi:MAG TPA: endonuclease III [Planctomycetota bacterium]|nr:endonuclease III [Planctomycetota bacterium]
MQRQEKARRIQRLLDQLIPETPVPLAHRDPYTLLIAVLLSAQCTDERVNRVTPLLFARADTPQAMRALSAAGIRAIIRPCGLANTKSKAIRALSQMLVRDHGGSVPASLDALERLPGVGHKTASVVMAQAFGIPALPVDTHVHRLATRWGLTSGHSRERTEADLKLLYAERDWPRLHLQLIWFGRRHCPALRHDPSRCPICSWAATRATIAAAQQRRAPRPARAHRRGR